MTRPVSVATVLLLAMAFPIGCGSSGNDSSDHTDAQPTTSTTADTDRKGDGGTSRDANDGGNSRPKSRGSARVIKWLRNFTPTGGGGPAAEAAYVNFMQGECQSAFEMSSSNYDSELGTLDEPLRHLYRGAAAACLAAFHGKAELWRIADEQKANVNPAELTCWDRSVYQILDAMVTAHSADPSAKFSRGTQADSGCPELTGLDPDTGPPEGGYDVEIRGRNLPATLDLLWDFEETYTARRRYEGGPLMLTIPPATSGQQEVSVKISGAPRISPVWATFTYQSQLAGDAGEPSENP